MGWRLSFEKLRALDSRWIQGMLGFGLLEALESDTKRAAVQAHESQATGESSA